MRALFLAVLLAASPAGAAYVDLGAGARAPGLGNAFTALADDVYAVHYNPAGLGQLERPELGTSYTKLLVGLGDGSDLGLMFLGYAHPLRGGARGTLATSWERFNLDSLYNEQTFTTAYGRRLEAGGGRLLLGGSVKYLRRSFGSFPEASNALNGIAATGRADPVLSGNKTASAFDADLGALYRVGERSQLGLSLTHVPQPNVAFSAADSDRLPMGVAMGLALRGSLTNTLVQYETRRSPTGSRDHVGTAAFERWLPFLLAGDFGFRAALKLGSRELRTLSAGLSHRTRRLSVDYSFAIPLGTIADTSGSHRLALTLRFGSGREPDESVLMLLEAMRRMRRGEAPDPHVLSKGVPPAAAALLREHVAVSDALLAQGEYRAALERFNQALALAPGEAELLKRYGRLNWVAQHVPRQPELKFDPVAAAWHQSALAYVAGDASAALERAAQALSMRPGDTVLAAFMADLSVTTGLPSPALAAGGAKRLQVAEPLARGAAAADAGRYGEAVSRVREALAIEPGNLDALELLGLSLFAVGEYRGSLDAWEEIARSAPDANRRGKAEGYAKTLRGLLKRRQAPVRPAALPAPAAAPAVEAPTPASPARLQELYDAGVDHYTAGRLDEAKAAFEEVLRLDPAYTPAAKALKRVNSDRGFR